MCASMKESSHKSQVTWKSQVTHQHKRVTWHIKGCYMCESGYCWHTCARVATAVTCARVATLDIYAWPHICDIYARPHICASVATFSGPASSTQTYRQASPTQTCQPVSPTQTIRWEVQAIQWGGLGGRQGLYRGALLAAKERDMRVCVRVCVGGRDRDRARRPLLHRT